MKCKASNGFAGKSVMVQNAPDAGWITLYYNGFGLFGLWEFVWNPKPATVLIIVSESYSSIKSLPFNLAFTRAPTFLPLAKWGQIVYTIEHNAGVIQR